MTFHLPPRPAYCLSGTVLTTDAHSFYSPLAKTVIETPNESAWSKIIREETQLKQNFLILVFFKQFEV